MKKKLLSILAIGALFLISCKKTNVLPEIQSQSDNQKDITNPVPGPIAVTVPTLFFMEEPVNNLIIDSAILFQASNLLAAKVTVAKKAILRIPAIKIQNFITTNPAWDYNTSTDEILTYDGLDNILKLSTKNFKFTHQSFVGANKSFNPSHMRVNPLNTAFFFINESGNKIRRADITSGLIDPKDVFNGTGLLKITAMDVDYRGKKIYFVDATNMGIFRIDFNGQNKVKVATIPLGESVKSEVNPILRLDIAQNKLFLSTHSNEFQSKQRSKLWSVVIFGNSWTKIFEATDPDTGLPHFSFDIWKGNKIFYTLYQNPKIGNLPISLVGRMNLDGTANSTFFETKRPVKNVVFVFPK